MIAIIPKHYVCYRRKDTPPCDNWVWPPQGEIDMYIPRMWGHVQFSAIAAGCGGEGFRQP